MIVRTLMTVGVALVAASVFAQGSGVDLSKAKLRTPAQLTEQAPEKFKAKFDTSKGAFVVEVHRDWAPKGADRFYNLVKNGFFDDTRFFRVVPDFMVQFGLNGDPNIQKNWANAKIRSSRATKRATSRSPRAARTHAPRSSSSTSRTTPASIARASRRSAKSCRAWTSSKRSTANTASGRCRGASRPKGTRISTKSSPSSITSRRRPSRNNASAIG